MEWSARGQSLRIRRSFFSGIQCLRGTSPRSCVACPACLLAAALIVTVGGSMGIQGLAGCAGPLKHRQTYYKEHRGVGRAQAATATAGKLFRWGHIQVLVPQVVIPCAVCNRADGTGVVYEQAAHPLVQKVLEGKKYHSIYSFRTLRHSYRYLCRNVYLSVSAVTA